MKLTEYSTLIKTFIDQGIDTIEKDGFVIGYNDIEYWNKQDFLDSCVEQIIHETLYSGDIEKDCDYAEAFKEAGIVDQYLKCTGILGRVIGKAF